MMADSDTSVTSQASSGSGSSEKNSLSSYLPPSAATKSSGRHSGTKARKLSSSLKDTADTLEDVDRMLGEYNSIARNQASSINRLREKIGKDSSGRRSRRSSASSLHSSDLDQGGRDRGSRRTYRTTSPLRDYQYGSDVEHRTSRRLGADSSHRRRPRSAVRFREDVRVDTGHIHGLHQSVRDLSADHERLESELEREIRNRYRHEREHERSIHDLASSFAAASHPPRQQVSHLDNVERRLERKLESIATRIESKQQAKSESGTVGIGSAPITQASLSRSLTEALRASQTNLAAPLPSQQSQVDLSLQRDRISELETDKRRVQNEMELVKQKHDQSEGSRRALGLQLEDLRNKLREVDDERHRALRLAEEYRDSEKKCRKKQREISRSSEDENQRLQMEIQDLRVQLSHTISREEVEVMRRELQKSEKQRVQLTEHIETLTKDIRNKEQNTSTLLAEVTELTSHRTRLEGDNARLQTDFEQIRNNLRDLEQDKHRLTQDVGSLTTDLNASERRKDEIKSKATEVVKLWKAKCKSLQKESDDYKDMNSDQSNRCDQLVNENDSLRAQFNSVSHQLDRQTKDMADMLTCNQDLEEANRKLELELKDMRRNKSDLEHTNHEQSLQLQKYERDVRKMNDQFINYEAESAQLADKLSAAKNQLDTIEQEHRELKSDHAHTQSELARRTQTLADRDSNIQDLETRLLTTEASESACKRELEQIHAQLNKQQENHERTANELLTRVDRLKKEISEVKSRELKTGEEYHRKFKHIQADKEADIESMRVDLEEARVSVQSVKRQAKHQNDEYVRMEQKYRQLEEDFTSYKIQTKRLKEQSNNMGEKCDQYETRCRELDSELTITHQKLVKLEQQHVMLSQTVRTELDVLVETGETTSEHKYSDIVDSGGSDLLTDITSRTSWLRRYMRQCQETERQLRQDMNMRLSKETSEKSELIAEIKRQQEAMDEMSDKHRELVDDVIFKEDEVNKLEDKITELSLHVEEHKAYDDVVERSRILDRYQRLQGAVSSLKQELRDSATSHTASLDALQHKESVFLTSGSRPSSRQRQVRISEVVSSNDGTLTSLKPNSPPSPPVSGTQADGDLQGRIDAYNRALGPNSYRTHLADEEADDIEEVKAMYINEPGGRQTQPAFNDQDVSYDGNYRDSSAMSGSYRPASNGPQAGRRHSTPHKTSSKS